MLLRNPHYSNRYHQLLTTANVFCRFGPNSIVGRSRPRVVIAIRIHTRARRTRMIATRRRDMRLRRLILVPGIRVTGRGTSVARFSGGARGFVRGSSTNSAELGVLGVGVVGRLWAAAAPEPAIAAAGGVVVGGRWAEALLALVVAAKPELEDCCDNEDEAVTCVSSTGSLETDRRKLTLR
jgi:hypothetical protein